MGYAAEASSAALHQLDLTHHWAGILSVIVMVAAYIAAMFEETMELRKSKPMLLAAALIWFFIVLAYQQQGNDLLAVGAFKSNLQSYIELLLFIMVSMTYLNAMEDMRIFDALKSWLVGKKIKLPAIILDYRLAGVFFIQRHKRFNCRFVNGRGRGIRR